MAEPNSNDSALVSGVRYFISDGAQTLELKHVESHSANDGNSGQVVSNANGESMGTSTTGGSYTINLKVRSSQKRREVAWKRLRQSKASFRFDIQPGKTRRDQYERCQVVTVNENGGNGEYSLDVTIIAEKLNPIDL